MNTAPKVVALMPAWNGEEFIARTLRSLAAQTYPNLEVLISDDASTDGTADICRSYAAEDSRFHFVRQSRNLGWIGNTNFLLKQCAADYLFIAFHDDLYRPEYVATLAGRLTANSRAAMAFSDLEIRKDTGENFIATYQRLDHVTSRLARARALIAREDNWWIPIHGLFRASCAKSIGGLKPHLAGEFSADWPWLVRMALLGEAERVGTPLCIKSWRQGSVSDGWNFAPRHWYAVALSCAQEVLAARIPASEKSILLRDLVSFCVQRKRESRDWMARQKARQRDAA